jgi:hypothetical protein
MAWSRPIKSEFQVNDDGTVNDNMNLIGFFQGMLHPEMRNPPTFSVNAGKDASIGVHVQAVAMAGARLQIRVDGKTVRTFDIPDRDGKNDGLAPEYDTTFSCPIPIGRHRVTVDNIGGDWATVTWYEFPGMVGEER